MACAIKKWDQGCWEESSVGKVFAIETEGPPYNVHIKMKADNEKKKLDVVVVCSWKLSAGELENWSWADP